MKAFIILLLMFTSLSAFSSAVIDCGPNLIRVWTQSNGMTCVPRMVTTQSQLYCLPINAQPFQMSLLQNFPVTLQNQTPWWAIQGNLYYPNMFYPGAWSYPGIQSNYYSGQGQVFAAKPNVYVETVLPSTKFSFKFVTKQHFLAQTPLLNKNEWRGRIFEKDKFEVDDVNYDYLFYDVRLPKEKMQFDHGMCSTREDAIAWMVKDLKELKHSDLSLQDFEEHWRVKIPDYPYYCVYPQYNRELDAAIPVEIDLERTTFIRSLYVLVPHKKEPDVDEPQEIPFPTNDPTEYRPGVKITRENTFREWGVAFLGF
ncbi:hypothetical protein ACJVC5_08885 [Peredibacter sp. HCB2-198]|uniref:hypothetical protein n=1 Tax=Peredibacter sp. HCB2-198 TaxID=3383025 RepID=UPI0038B493F2